MLTGSNPSMPVPRDVVGDRWWSACSGDMVMINAPGTLVHMARLAQSLGVRPEIEIFDAGHLHLAQWLVAQGVIDDPVMVQLCMGVPWGIPDDLNSFMARINNLNLPKFRVFSAFSLGRSQSPYAALATGEHMLLHVDVAASLACPAGKAVAARIAAIREAQSSLPRPEAAGRVGRANSRSMPLRLSIRPDGIVPRLTTTYRRDQGAARRPIGLRMASTLRKPIRAPWPSVRSGSAPPAPAGRRTPKPATA